MKTIKIKGKDYIEVNERIKFFRANFSDYSLTSKVIEKTPESILIKATIKTQKIPSIPKLLILNCSFFGLSTSS